MFRSVTYACSLIGNEKTGANSRKNSLACVRSNMVQGPKAQCSFKEKKSLPQLQKSIANRTECQLILVMPALFVDELPLSVSARDSLGVIGG